MDTLALWVGYIVISLVSFSFLTVLTSFAWVWFSTAYFVWRGYVTAHESHPDLNIISGEFQDQYGKYWKLVLLGAFITQKNWLFSVNGKLYETEWFIIDFSELVPVIDQK